MTTIDLIKDLLNASGPDKGLRLFVVLSEIVFDRGDEFLDASEVGAAQALGGQFTKPTFHQVEPGGTGGSAMDVKTLVLSQPRSDVVMFMGTVIVDNQMHGQTARGFSIQLAQELQVLLMTVAGQALTNHRAVQHIEGGKKTISR